jgi:hypothetical protein
VSVRLRIKVDGGTISGDSFLCESCQHSTVMRGASIKEMLVRCCAHDGPPFSVAFRVLKCNSYEAIDSTDLKRMKHQAGWLHTNAYGGVHLLTFAQYEDYNYRQALNDADKAAASPAAPATAETPAPDEAKP